MEGEDLAEQLRGNAFEVLAALLLRDLEFHGEACDWLKFHLTKRAQGASVQP
jgi:hypothetical protein